MLNAKTDQKDDFRIKLGRITRRLVSEEAFHIAANRLLKEIEDDDRRIDNERYR